MCQTSPNGKPPAGQPPHRGEEHSTQAVGSAGGRGCEDSITVRLCVRADVIEDISAEARGCETAAACADALAALARGRHLDDAAEITGETVAVVLGGLPREKRHVADLAAEALENAVWDYVARVVERHSATEPQ